MPADNLYIFGDEQEDRYRLQTQTKLFSDFIRNHAQQYCGDEVRSILDLGCGEGQLGMVLREVYPNARLVGIDRDTKAIEAAHEQARARQLADVEFVVGDIEQAIPAGPFDLIYSSMVLLHTHQPARLISRATDELTPGGHLWIKDLRGNNFTQALDHPSYRRLAEMIMSAMTAMGAQPFVADQMPELLQAASLELKQTEEEPYPLGGSSEAGRATMALTLGVFYNARFGMSRMQNRAVEDIEQMYVELANMATLSPGELGRQVFVNFVAQKLA